MAELRRSDLAGLVELAMTASSVTDLEAFGRVVIGPLRRLVHADSVTYNEIDTRRHRAAGAVDPLDALDGGDLAAFERYVGQHPLVAHSKRTTDGRARAISDFLDRRQLHRTDLYATYFRPVGVEHQLAITLDIRPALVVGIACNRVTPDFTSRERAILDAARPQLVASYRAAVAATERLELMKVMEQGLEDLGRGVVLVDPDGRLAAATPTAERLLAVHRGVRVAPGQQLPARLLNLATGAPSRAGPVALRGQGATLYVHALGDVGAGSNRQRILVVDARPDLGGGAPPLSAAGLTRRELDILRRLAAGWSNVEIAREVGISLRTVHKHLEHLYAKLGVHGRTAAATRFLNEPGLSVEDEAPVTGRSRRSRHRAPPASHPSAWDQPF